MTHFGIISPPVPGHINPMSALGRELQRRGHRVTFFHIPDIKSKILAEGLNFWSIGQSDHPLGSLPKYIEQMGKLRGIPAMRFGIKIAQSETTMICRDAPIAFQEAGIEALLVDQGEPAGGAVARFLSIPFITVCSAVAANREVAIPPSITPWSYRLTWWAYLRNYLGYFLFDQFTEPIRKVIARYQRQWKQPVYRTFDDSFSPLAQISQQTDQFDFPRKNLPECFHYIGSLRNSSSQTVPFPFDKLTGQPLIYASLGTLQNGIKDIFYFIAQACEELDAQLVITLGRGSKVEEYQKLPGQPIVVEYAPQLEILAKASLTITCGGLNTVMDSLSNGVPLVAIPIATEQPGIAARISRTGAGEMITLNNLSVTRLQEVIKKVLTEDSYHNNAERLKESIQKAGGVVRAADIIEQAISTKKPVLSKISSIAY